MLRRGATVTGQVVGPDGQPVRDAWIFSRIILDPRLGRMAELERSPSTARCATAVSRSTGSTPMPRFPSISSTPGASWARRESLGQVDRAHDIANRTVASRRRDDRLLDSPWPAGRSPSGSSPAAPPGRGSSIPTASRSRDVYRVDIIITMVVTPGPPCQSRDRARPASSPPTRPT